MNDLLSFAVDAHGGLASWNAFSDLELKLSIGGAIWEFKKNPALLRDVTCKMKTHVEQLTITGFSAPDRRITFVPNRLTLGFSSSYPIGNTALRLSAKPPSTLHLLRHHLRTLS